MLKHSKPSYHALPMQLKRLLPLIFLLVSSTVLAREYVVGTPLRPHMALDMSQSVATEAYRRLGHTLRLSPRPLERTLLEANAGALDGELMRITLGIAQYPNLIPVKFPIAHDEFVAYGIGKRILIKNYSDLKPFRLSTVRGIKEFEHLSTEGYQVLLATDGDQAFRQLEAGRVDFVLLTRGASCTPKQLGITGIEIQDGTLGDLNFYHHLHSQHSALIPQLETALRSMQKDGSLKRIQDQARRRWLACDNE